MKIDKLFNGLKHIANGAYVLEGDLISAETIEIDLDDCFVVKGKIRAKKSIVVRLGIEAGEGIEAKTFIDASKRIFAGISIYRTSKNCNKTIRCAELRSGEICYGDLTLTKEAQNNEG